MEIGIGLPNTVPGTTGEQLTEWARRADAAGFSSLGTIDRLAYPNIEPLIALAAAAAVTERIGLATSILIAPYRLNPTLIAKQAASVHRVSGGRMTLGIAVGGREDDYRVAGADFDSRGGENFERMLARIREVWSGSDASSGAAEHEGVGPDVSSAPPRLIVGGTIDATFRRAAEYGDGWIMGGGTPDAFAEAKAKLERAWSEAGREGSRTRWASPTSRSARRRAQLGRLPARLLRVPRRGRRHGRRKRCQGRRHREGLHRGFEQAGCDEFILFPGSADPTQVDLLAEVAL